MKFIKLFKRWFNMLTGKSVFHVKQGIGKYYSKDDIKGYYNDLTGKVIMGTLLDEDGIPVVKTIAGVVAHFPIAIFQYGLGLYDLYLEKKEKKYLEEFFKIADYALENIKENGMWDCMGTLKDTKHETQSAMCQSEGVSVLVRAYKETKEKKYLNCAKKAIDFMIKDVKNGGTCLYDNEDIIFQEYVSNDNLSVLNGWIFSIFGLYDYSKISKDKKYKTVLDNSVNTLSKSLNKYDRKYWSNYDQKSTIASPAYHDIHIMQLEILYNLFGKEEFNIYITKWKKYQSNKIFKFLAMLVKLKQKLFKSKYYDINTSTI